MADEKTNNLKVKVVDTKSCSITLNVEVPHADVASETEKVFDEIYKVAKVAGFRPGKAPLEMVRKNYSETARDRVIENLLHKNVFKALEIHNFSPIDSPIINEMNFEFDKPFLFTFTAEKHPEFKIKSYKGIKIKKVIKVIDDKLVNETLEGLLERNAQLVESASETAGQNSFVSVDYTCSLGGEALDALGAKNQMIDMSSKQVIPGFKEGLTGAKKGEERRLKIKFPDDYPDKKAAGKEIDFVVKVNGIKEKVFPILDDEFAKDIGSENLSDLKTKIKESLEYEEKNRLNEETERQLFDELLKSNEFVVPKTLVEEQKNIMLKRLADYLKQQGYDQKAVDKNLEQAKEKYAKDAENTVRLSYILGAVAKEEKIEVTEKDLQDEFDRIRKSNPGKEKEVGKYISEKKGRIATALKEEKIFKFLLDSAKITETTEKT